MQTTVLIVALSDCFDGITICFKKPFNFQGVFLLKSFSFSIFCQSYFLLVITYFILFCHYEETVLRLFTKNALIIGKKEIMSSISHKAIQAIFILKIFLSKS